MPAEWEPHERCIMGWPTQIRIGSVWNEHYLLAMASYAAVAHAIARFEPVLMLARPGEGEVARSYLGRDVEVVEMPIDDSWLRDSGPIFVTRPDGTLAMSDFTFNSWGEKYLPYDNDAAIGRRLAEHFGVERFAAPMVLEGGGITVDGEGTLITTESCLLHPSRNPGLTKDEMTQILKDYLGVEKVIWLISGLGLDEDPDTDGHVDGVGAFVAPGRVLLHMVRDPQHPDYENLLENRRRLETTDARGRELEVIEFDRRSTAGTHRRHAHRRDVHQLVLRQRRAHRPDRRNRRRRPDRPRRAPRDRPGSSGRRRALPRHRLRRGRHPLHHAAGAAGLAAGARNVAMARPHRLAADRRRASRMATSETRLPSHELPCGGIHRRRAELRDRVEGGRRHSRLRAAQHADELHPIEALQHPPERLHQVLR